MLGGEGGIGDLEEDREGASGSGRGRNIISGDVKLYKYGVSSIQYRLSSILYLVSYIDYPISSIEYPEWSMENTVSVIQ